MRKIHYAHTNRKKPELAIYLCQKKTKVRRIARGKEEHCTIKRNKFNRMI